MKELVRYLLENIYIDFQGDIHLETVLQFLAKDNSPEARALVAKIKQDNSVEDMLITVADTLKPEIPQGIDDATVFAHLKEYADS